MPKPILKICAGALSDTLKPVMSGRIWTPPDCNGFGKGWSQGHNC
jgi:hypothetical protein